MRVQAWISIGQASCPALSARPVTRAADRDCGKQTDQPNVIHSLHRGEIVAHLKNALSEEHSKSTRYYSDRVVEGYVRFETGTKGDDNVLRSDNAPCVVCRGFG